MSSYPKDWNLFAFYGIFKEHDIRESMLALGTREYVLLHENVRIDNWWRHYDYGAATIEPHDGGVLHVDVCAINPVAESYVDFVEGTQHGWYAKRWARELFGYTWLGMNEPEIDCYVYQMNITPEREELRNDGYYSTTGTIADYDISRPR